MVYVLLTSRHLRFIQKPKERYQIFHFCFRITFCLVLWLPLSSQMKEMAEFELEPAHIRGNKENSLSALR